MDASAVWRQRAVIIHRDENGYGLTVFGDNPVSVQTIKKGEGNVIYNLIVFGESQSLVIKVLTEANKWQLSHRLFLRCQFLKR
jgi:hypothetical protein